MPQGNTVVRLESAYDRRARREFDRLLVEARSDLAAVAAGDLAAVYTAHRAVGRLVVMLFKYRWDAA